MKTAIATEAKAVELLSKITGKTLDQRDVTPPVLFLTALMTLLLGVMAADQTVSDEEKQRWQIAIKRFVGGNTQLAQLISKGIREHRIFTRVDELQTLTAAFSDSEKLLLLALGYDMSLADGSADPSEKAYLQSVAAQLGVKYTHLSVLEASWTQQAIVNPSALEEVRFLLDPARFRDLDAVFTNAANELWEVLPVQTSKQDIQTQSVVSYSQLEKFQQSRKALDALCCKLYAIIQEGVEQELPLNVEAADVVKISKKLQSQNFRLAVLGEFSQGKSSLLNALLGEKIQPVRALPCSGTISILRYGTEKRVICRYRDGRQEEIALEEYKEKAAIPKEVAMGGTLREALTQTEIQELIFEHPNLELCKNGVEIIDSPGLNEHPDRTALTYQLLKETDAAIFLASAKHPLTESEQSLLQELKTQLNDGRSERPATNLFVAVNFMDLLDEEEDNPQDIQQRFERLLRGNPPVLMGENRIHYISAKSALNALLKGQENQYLQSFQHFTQAIEAFLTQERGVLQLQKSVEDMTEVIQTLQSTLQTAKGAVEGELISHAKKAEFLEQIAEAGGREVKLMILAEELSNEVCDKFDKAWDKWAEGLEDRLLEKVDGWNSSHSKTFSQDKVIQDYVDQFFRDVTYELDCFQDQHFAPILEGAMKILDQAIARELKALQGQSQAFDKRISSKASRVLDKQVSGIESHFFVGKLKYLALPALAFLPGLILPVAIGAGLGALTGFFDGDQATKLKLKVFDAGCEKFSESLDSVVQQLVESIVKAFDDRVEGATEAIQQVMQSYETAIAQQEKAASRSPEHTKAMRAWIVQKNQELEQLEKSLKSFQTQMLQ